MNEGNSQTNLKARLAGAFYLMVIVGGLFSEGLVRGQLIIPGDAAATAAAIRDQEGLWRAGLAAHLLYLIATVPMSLLIYELLKPAGATLARLALCFSLICSTVEVGSLLQIAVPLSVLRNEAALGAIGPEQLHAIGYLAARLFSTGFAFALLFFAGFCVLVGVLIWRSRMVPGVIGLLMLLAGTCYFVNSLAGLLAPDTARVLFPWILLPSLVGELALGLWLLLGSLSRSGPAGAVQGQ